MKTPLLPATQRQYVYRFPYGKRGHQRATAFQQKVHDEPRYHIVSKSQDLGYRFTIESTGVGNRLGRWLGYLDVKATRLLWGI